MARQYDVKAKWIDVDPDELSDRTRNLYDAYRELIRQKAAAQALFETAMRSDYAAPAGMRLVFGYRFGKLSTALVPDDGVDRTRRADKPKLSLAEWLEREGAR
jgi:hypothetical protein